MPVDPMIETRQFIQKNVDALVKGIQSVGLLVMGTTLTKGAIEHVVSKFFEMESMPAKTTYVDWWPRTCQQVREVGSKFWARRAEGGTVAGVASTGITISWLYAGSHPLAHSLWELADGVTTSCLNFFGFQTVPFGVEPQYVSLWAIPAIFGIGTTIGLGSYDLVAKYFDIDRVLETKPIFNATLQEELDEILNAARQNVEEQSFCQNLLLCGPPGTGKTMVSKWIASNSNMNHMFLSGGDIVKPGTASVAILEKLIGHAQSLTSPTVVFIDEAEAVFGTRDKERSQEYSPILNALLELTGQPTSKMMLVLATNRPSDIDSAVLSRMDYKIYVGVPALEERKKMIEWNVDILVPSEELRSVFTQDIIDHIAKRTEGCSGRDLFKLVIRLKIEVKRTGSLDEQGIDKIVKKFVKQEQLIELHKSSENPLKSNPLYLEHG